MKAQLLLLSLASLWIGCDTGFGQPCSLPETEEFRRACQPSEVEGNDAGISVASKPSCAVKNFAGCETRVCLVYRGSDSFCSEPCKDKSDCEGSAECRPLLGDSEQDSNICDDGFTECYCIRAADLEDE